MAITFGNNVNPADQMRVQQYVEDQRPELKELADWIVEHYEETYDLLREATIIERGEDMGREANYTPMRRMDVTFTPDEREIHDELMRRHHLKKGYAEKGMTMMRQDISPEFQKPIRLDAVTMLLQQIERQEHYIAFGPLARDLQAIGGDEAVREAVRRRGGSDAVEFLQHYVDAVGNPNIFRTYGKAERMARLMRRHTAIAFLGYKLSTMLKQPVSMVRYLPHAGLHLLRAGLEAATDWGQVRATMTELDPLLAAPPLERELEEMKAADPKGYEALIKKVGEPGMQGIVWMDSIGRTIGQYGVYLKEMAEHGNKGRAVEAARRATSLTQAGARAYQLPEMYRTNQEFLRLLTMFTNELNKLWNIGTYDFPQLLKNHQWERAAGTFVAIGLEATLMWMIANKALPDDEDDWMDLFSEQFVAAIPIFGPAIVATAKGFSGGVSAIEGPAQGVVATVKELGQLAAGESDDQTILDAAHKVYRGVAPLAGLPYTGPRDIARTILNEDPTYLLGGTPPKRQTTGRRSTGRRGSGRRAATGRR